VSIAPTSHQDSTTTSQETHASSRTHLADDPAPVKRTRRRASTSHLKEVPETLALREEIKAAAERFAQPLDKSRPFSKGDLEAYGRELLAQMNLPEKYLGFAMVLIGNFFWKRQFLAMPFERRMLLLPHCLKHAEGCPADYDEFGLDCERCGACSIADYKVKAEQLGYKVLVAEGSPIVLKIIVSGYIDGILGVACLNVLEKAIDKVLIAGVPSYAIPLHSGDCKNTTLDESWVWDVLEKYEPLPEPQTSSYVPLMRAANGLFEDRFETLLPRVRTKTPEAAASPLGKTEQISYDWLAHGGKRFRPFMTLAAYDALTGAQGLSAGPGGEAELKYSDGVGRVAMAIEAFHKASLVHDDIEDDDQYRYGQETLHRKYDLGTAINVGDHLIGLGYRLVSSARSDIGAEAAADILDRMASAHVKLCDGQGAEMAWQTAPNAELTPLDALQIYALKTSPAFEAALYAGLRMAGPTDAYEEFLPQFARQIGVGFQILNDLKDWRGDDNNKLIAGQDALSLRPTVLLALAYQSAGEAERQTLHRLIECGEPAANRIGELRELFEKHKVFDKAEVLIEKSRTRAEALVEEIESEDLQQLFHFLIDTVLAPEDVPKPNLPPDPVMVPLQISGA
jgi:geranylgeranyl diphosphate synthase, type II